MLLLDHCVSVFGPGWTLDLSVVQVMVVMYIVICTSNADHHRCARNVWNRRSLCGHCRVILPTYLPACLVSLSIHLTYTHRLNVPSHSLV